jgi:SnoaL-like protein
MRGGGHTRDLSSDRQPSARRRYRQRRLLPRRLRGRRVIDLGGGKAANGNEAIAAVVKTPEHQAAIAGGLCHFAGLPRVQLNGDTAVAISYLQVIAPNREAKPVELSGHGLSSGYRIHRLGANRWDLRRTKDGWKVTRRAYRMLDGTEGARELLRQAVTK